LPEQRECCFRVAGFKRLNSVLLRRVSNCGEEGISDRNRVFLTLGRKLRVGEAPCDLVVDVEVCGLRGCEFRWLPLREAFADLVSVVCVVDEPLFADFLVL
jgi:hypothetical protein